MRDEIVVSIRSDQDMVEARAKCRRLADDLGFSRTDATLIATAISEIARNILVHAGRGEISMRPLCDDGSWKHEYNTYRPHSSLGWRCPVAYATAWKTENQVDRLSQTVDL